MATLTYWVATIQREHDAYSIIAKTKKECVAKVSAQYNPEDYLAPVKKTVFYKDAFDLYDQATGEGGGRTWTGCSD